MNADCLNSLDHTSGYIAYESGDMRYAAFVAWLQSNNLTIQDPRGASALDQWASSRALLQEIRTLEANWDGYNGVAPGDVVTNNAEYILSLFEAAPFYISPPDLAPTTGGTIAISWESEGTEIYLEIGKTRYSGYTKSQAMPTQYLEGQVAEIERLSLSLPIFIALNSNDFQQSIGKDYGLSIAA